MNILKIDTSPRREQSNSRILGDYLVQQLDGDGLTVMDLSAHPLPAMSAEDLIALHASRDNGYASLEQHVSISDGLIAELKGADTLVIGIPVHNFSIPLVLKQWVDYICRAGHTFRYGSDGPQGLSDIERAYLVVSAGGMEIGGTADFASRYMAHVCRFIGVREIHIIDASGSKGTPEAVIARGKEQIDLLLEEITLTHA